jgi:hypothetical protein
MAYEFDIDKVQDYIESVAERNKNVGHNVNGVRSFARYHSDDQMIEIKKNAGKNIVVVVDTGGHRVGHKDDRMLQRELVLRFACYAEKNGDVAAAKKAAITKAEEIMFDFMTEMELQQESDLDQDIPCGVMHYLQPENYSWQEITDQPWLLNHFGWDLTVPFRTYMPAHDAAKWV